MCAKHQSNWLHTMVVRASYILPILKRFPWISFLFPRKTGGVVYLPSEKAKTETSLSFLVLG